ncbi:MAG: hypothetical protein HEP71_31375 [Roseivirga sp.]|nr:hypothetical protein [Roseivirga sp.]
MRRLFKVGNKVRWLALELLVVFIGVYLAFLFQGYTEERKNENEREKVLVSLKKEVEKFRLSAPLNATGQRNQLNKWRAAFSRGEVVRFDSWRFLEPQYNFQVIEYAINLQGTEIIEFELYEAISELYREIKQLEHAERRMTNLSDQYKIVPKALSENSEAYQVLTAENLFHFQKFIGAAADRVGNLDEVATRARKIAVLINERLSTEKQQEIAFEILQEFFPNVEGDTVFLKELYMEKFEEIPVETLDEELRKLVREYDYN